MADEKLLALFEKLANRAVRKGAFLDEAVAQLKATPVFDTLDLDTIVSVDNKVRETSYKPTFRTPFYTLRYLMGIFHKIGAISQKIEPVFLKTGLR